MLAPVLAFLVAIGVLVTFHEFGHYWVARRLGVKVLRFSIGFGKPLCSWRHGDTEWALAPIPLGGYVKMLDTREGPVAAEELHLAFDRQPVGSRIAIVAAGPLANLLLAAVFLTLVFWGGVEGLRPVVGAVLPHTPAAEAGVRTGDTVEAVNGRAVADWHDLRVELLDALTDRGTPLRLALADGRSLTIPARQLTGIDVEKGLGTFGLSPARQTTTIQYVDPDSPSAAAGIRPGDRVVAMDRQPLRDWTALVAMIQEGNGRAIRLNLMRDGRPLAVMLTPQREKGQGVWRAGLAPVPDAKWLESLKFTREYGFADALAAGVKKTWDSSVLTLKMIGRMLIGDVSPRNISGPITMADYAGRSASAGLSSFLDYLALISISLGVLNLLPIPMLDGGHLMYYGAELVRGRPLSDRVQEAGRRIGLAALGLLMTFAIFNDLTRLFAG